MTPDGDTESSLNAEIWRQVAVRVAKRGINTARSLLRQHSIAPFEGVMHGPAKLRGDKTSWIDVQMRDAMMRYVREECIDGALYLGEEEDVPAILRYRSMLSRADELDGTTSSLTVFSGYAVVVFFERVTRAADSVWHVAGAIAACTGEVTSWSRGSQHEGRKVLIDWPTDLQWIDDTDPLPPNEVSISEHSGAIHQLEFLTDSADPRSANMRSGVASRVASNSINFERRGLIRAAMGPALDDPSTNFWLTNGAGNPIVAPLLCGELGAVYEPKALQLHDAAYLVPLTMAGGRVTTPTGHHLDVLGHFSELGSDRTIGPFIAAPERAGINFVVRALKSGDR